MDRIWGWSPKCHCTESETASNCSKIAAKDDCCVFLQCLLPDFFPFSLFSKCIFLICNSVLLSQELFCVFKFLFLRSLTFEDLSCYPYGFMKLSSFPIILATHQLNIEPKVIIQALSITAVTITMYLLDFK